MTLSQIGAGVCAIVMVVCAVGIWWEQRKRPMARRRNVLPPPSDSCRRWHGEFAGR